MMRPSLSTVIRFHSLAHARRRGGSHEDLHGEGPESAVRHETATVRAVRRGQTEGTVEIESRDGAGEEDAE